MLQFVVLLHELPDDAEIGSHWDWMFETGTTLETWRTPIGDGMLAMFEIGWPCERLADHRRDYLDYQGPVSQNRGSVSQVFRGRYEPLAETATRDNSAPRILFFDGINIEDFPSCWRWEVVGGETGMEMRLTAIDKSSRPSPSS